MLELGCGTGELSRRLAPHVARVDAVDPSQAMLRVARAAPGGDAPNITWVCSTGEDFAFTSTYSLAVAAESFHWMDATVVMPALRRVLVPDGRLAIVGRGEETPWAAEFHEIIVEYSAYAGPGVFRPRDVPAELSEAGMWEVDERFVTPGVAFRQRTEDYIELQHSRASFARYRMGAARAAEFDEALRRAAHWVRRGGLRHVPDDCFARRRPPDLTVQLRTRPAIPRGRRSVLRCMHDETHRARRPDPTSRVRYRGRRGVAAAYARTHR